MKSKEPKWTVTLEKKMPECLEFVKNVLNPMLQNGNKGCELIHLKINHDTSTITIHFGCPTNDRLLNKVVLCVETAMNSWCDMINSTKTLATVAACCITNTYKYAEEISVRSSNCKKKIPHRSPEA